MELCYMFVILKNFDFIYSQVQQQKEHKDIHIYLHVQMMGLYEKYEYVVVCVLYCSLGAGSWSYPDITFVKAEQ